MKKPTTHIVMHNHAPASFDQVEQLAMDRAESDAFELAQTFASCRKPTLTDEQKLADKLVAAQKQAELDREMLLIQLNEAQYKLHKTRAECTAAVLLVMFVSVTLAVTLGVLL